MEKTNGQKSELLLTDGQIGISNYKVALLSFANRVCGMVK